MFMWNLKKIDFLFYNFSVIYYNFFKYLAEINKKEKDKKFIEILCTKIYNIICSFYRSTDVESNKIGFSIYNFSVIYYNFLKIQPNRSKTTVHYSKTAFETAPGR